MVNKDTSQEYFYDTSKQGYNLDGVIIEIKEKKLMKKERILLVNKDTGKKYLYDPSKQGYSLDGMIIEIQPVEIKDKKLINKGTGREYSYDTSKQGYDLGSFIIEERYIEDYLNTAQDKWIFCQEDNETFKIKCTTSGSFLRDEFTGN